MLVSPVFFSTTLTDALGSLSRGLPISDDDMTTLTADMEEGDFAYLTLREPTGAEIVLATNTCGGIVLTRGQGNTTPRKFPKGSCVRWEMTPVETKYLICNYDCCDDMECGCDAVTSAGSVLPSATVGVPWTGTFIFEGDTPMEIGISNQPSWAEVTSGANYVTLSGIPTDDSSVTVSVAATNCSGDIAVQQGTITVTAE